MIVNNKAKKITIGQANSGQRLDNFLMSQIKNIPKSHVYKLIRTGQVRINSSRSKPMNEDKVNAIDDWSDFRQGHTKLKGSRIKVIYGYMASNVKRGFKSGKKAPDDLEAYSLQDCIDKFGLLTTDTWDKAFLKLPLKS